MCIQDEKNGVGHWGYGVIWDGTAFLRIFGIGRDMACGEGSRLVGRRKYMVFVCRDQRAALYLFCFSSQQTSKLCIDMDYRLGTCRYGCILLEQIVDFGGYLVSDGGLWDVVYTPAKGAVFTWRGVSR